MDEHLEIKYTDQEITPFGGLSTVRSFFKKSGHEVIMNRFPLPPPGSNGAYDTVDLVEGFLVNVLMGASRLPHSVHLRHDEVISKMFDWRKGMASIVLLVYSSISLMLTLTMNYSCRLTYVGFKTRCQVSYQYFPINITPSHDY